MNKVILTLLMSALPFAVLRAETVKVPVLFRISSPAVRFRTVGAGFTSDAEKYIWAFQIDRLPELLKKDNLSFGYYSDVDNNPKTGLPPWDFMLNI